MKWILLPLMWLAAVCLAVFVAYRMWRGKPVVLRGRFSQRLIRRVVIVLVILGFNGTNQPNHGIAAPLPIKPDGPHAALPESVTSAAVTRWLALHQPHGALSYLKQRLIAIQLAGGDKKLMAKNIREASDAGRILPAEMRKLLSADADRLAAGKALEPVAAQTLLTIVDELEKESCYDHVLNAYLWRRVADITAREDARTVIALFARLDRHARITNTLIRAQAQARPAYHIPRAWLSKIGPRPGAVRPSPVSEADLAAMLKAAQERYPTTDAGTWLRDGIVLLKVAKDSPRPTLHRGGKHRFANDGETIRLNRLDLLETPDGTTPVTLAHEWLGTLTLPAGTVTNVWDLPALLTDKGKTQARDAIRAALADNEPAAKQIERALPLVHALLREELQRHPRAKGAPRLRLILALFDDVPMPELAAAR